MAEQPMNPLAGAAGPGPFSTRTDQLKFQSDSYGAGVENAANKAGAPLSKTASVNPTSLSEQGMAPSQQKLTGLFAPSERPDEEVTAGIAMGPGPGPEALGLNMRTQKTSDALAKMIPFDTTGEITILYQQALARGD